MTKYKNLSSPTKNMVSTFALVIGLFLILQILLLTGSVSSLVKGQLVPICAYIVMAVSLNLTVGILGELSLGHAGFMSVGAFSGVVMSSVLKQAGASDGLRLFVSILTGCVFGAIVGFLIGIPVLRLKGDYLAIVTLAFGEIIKSIMNNLYIGLDASGLHVNMLKDNLNMTDGRVIISGPMGVSGNDKLSTFFAGFLLILFCLFVIFNFVDSRAGRAVAAQRDNYIATESVGINVTKYKLTAFTISAGMAGMAGTLFALNYSTVVASKFDFNTSILVLVFVVLGGLGNMKGSILAAIVLTLLPELLRAFSTYRMLLYAIVLILIMLITNNPEMKHVVDTVLSRIKGLFRRRKGGAVND
ncbi:MAG: branched-chain amino acid ABC transporter permease [Clostridia bacterium]|nr:branched-chain amino acid ABC transporter permease [Clostridia bacterium]MBR0445256.1 branched-chain amino acid ABC transporter permease [Clostridia bacterium]